MKRKELEKVRQSQDALRRAVAHLQSVGLAGLPAVAGASEIRDQERGYVADLIAESESEDGAMFRIWRNRVGPEDGETHLVEVEELRGGRWEMLAKLYPYAVQRIH